jgi:tetratricopeptide (TPR) repeat protein
VDGASIILSAGDKELANWGGDLRPGNPLKRTIPLPAGVDESELCLVIHDSNGAELLRYSARRPEAAIAPTQATEPPPPGEIASADELYITGLHLEQYRHATRQPELYWEEALRRDPRDSRCNNAMGLWHLRRGEFNLAEDFFRRAIERLTRRNPNPSDGEPFYNLGLSLNFQQRHEEAYAAFYKATWNAAWQAAAYHAIAEIDCRRGDWSAAIAHLDLSLQFNSQNLRARNLKAIAMGKSERAAEAQALLRETLAIDPLDWWARHLLGEELHCDPQVRLDLALDYMSAGLTVEAMDILTMRHPSGANPLFAYYRAYLNPSPEHLQAVAAASPDYCFPSRLEEIPILQSAIARNPGDARALYYLGNLFYDRRRREEAIELWKRAAKIDPAFPTVWRNLGIGLFNVHKDQVGTRAAYDRAIHADPADARLLYERDQLRKRLGDSPIERLSDLCNHLDLVARRDDLSIELCTLYNQVGRHEEALALLASRNFQPWEGGEGLAIAQHTRANLAIGRRCLNRHEPQQARNHFESALRVPPNLGEARHPLANLSDIHYWRGMACLAEGDELLARRHWTAAAEFQGDFVDMSVRSFSEMTYYTILSLQQLGHADRARRMLEDLSAYAQKLRHTPAKIDYFATSLPAMLLFEDDPDARQKTLADVLEAQAALGLGDEQKAASLLIHVLSDDPNHAVAADLMSYLNAPRGSTVRPYTSFKTPASPA